MLGNRLRGVGGNAYDADAQILGGLQVDIVVARASHRQDSSPVGCQFGQDRTTQVVVDEGTDHWILMRQAGRLGIEAYIKIVELITEGLVRQLKMVTVVGFGTEQSNLHEAPPAEYVIKLHQW